MQDLTLRGLGQGPTKSASVGKYLRPEAKHAHWPAALIHPPLITCTPTSHHPSNLGKRLNVKCIYIYI